MPTTGQFREFLFLFVRAGPARLVFVLAGVLALFGFDFEAMPDSMMNYASGAFKRECVGSAIVSAHRYFAETIPFNALRL
jgi:hypothetical protein